VLFIIEDLDPAFHQTALSLGYDRVGTSFASTCPASSPYVAQAFQNFQKYIEPLLLQSIRIQPAPWERSLLAWLDIVEADGTIEWWLKGSVALAIRGLVASPKDIDLVVREEDTDRVDDLLAEWLIQPTIPTPGWVHHSFGRSFLHCCLEWCGGVSQTADAMFASDQGPAAAARLETVEWRGHPLRVPPLDLALNTAQQRGQPERASQILQAMGIAEPE